MSVLVALCLVVTFVVVVLLSIREWIVVPEVSEVMQHLFHCIFALFELFPRLPLLHNSKQLYFVVSLVNQLFHETS